MESGRTVAIELARPDEEMRAVRFRERERKILSAAMELVAERDPQWITVEQIARQAGVGKGTIYKHFTSREDLFGSIVSSFFARLGEQLHRIPSDQSVLDRLQAAIWVYWSGHRVESAMRRIVLYTDRPDFRDALDDDSRNRLNAALSLVGGAFESILVRGIENGIFSARPIHLMLHTLVATMDGSIRLMWKERFTGPESEYQGELTRFIIAGMMRHDRR